MVFTLNIQYWIAVYNSVKIDVGKDDKPFVRPRCSDEEYSLSCEYCCDNSSYDVRKRNHFSNDPTNDTSKICHGDGRRENDDHLSIGRTEVLKVSTMIRSPMMVLIMHAYTKVRTEQDYSIQSYLNPAPTCSVLTSGAINSFDSKKSSDIRTLVKNMRAAYM